MTKFHLLTALATISLAFLVAPQPAAAQAQSGGKVAIIDLTYVFKHHARFESLTTAMRRDVEAAEAQLKTERDALTKLVEQLDDYRKGTPEYKNLEEDLAKRQADLQLQVSMQKRNFLEQEARIYYDVYQEIMRHVQSYCESTGTVLVLRFAGDPIDPNDPQQILKELNKSVLYYQPAIDITPIILDQVNRQGPAAAQANPVGRPTHGVIPR